MSHLEYDWNSPVWRPFIAEFSRDHQMVRYDQRGTGLSDRNVDDLSLDAFVSDLETIVYTLELKRFPLLAVSQGGPVAMAFAARHPEMVSHIILLGSFATGWKRAKLEEKVYEKRMAQMTLIRQGWSSHNPAIRQLWSSMCIPDSDQSAADSFNELQRVSATPDKAARIFEAIGEFDVSHLLDGLQVPVLVAHSVQDAVVPFDEGRSLATKIPGAKFLALESRNHLLMTHEPSWKRFVSAVRDFIGAPFEEPAAETASLKICPTCGRRYRDDEMAFCLDDGTMLDFVMNDPDTIVLRRNEDG
jgi:pimeloyl-ACP methyl ester carboxylesterase